MGKRWSLRIYSNPHCRREPRSIYDRSFHGISANLVDLIRHVTGLGVEVEFGPDVPFVSGQVATAGSAVQPATVADLGDGGAWQRSKQQRRLR